MKGVLPFVAIHYLISEIFVFKVKWLNYYRVLSKNKYNCINGQDL